MKLQMQIGILCLLSTLLSLPLKAELAHEVVSDAEREAFGLRSFAKWRG